MEFGGEQLDADVRVVVSPVAGVFVPVEGEGPARLVDVGTAIGFVRTGPDVVPVLSAFRGRLGGVDAAEGERLTAHQRVAWLRVA